MKLPKFYNPFKAHIVQFADGKFAVRRLTSIGWEYKEHTTHKDDDSYWWYLFEYVEEYCTVCTHEEAVILRDKQIIKPNKVVKVYT